MDPRVEGGRYYSGYWAEEYEVLAVHPGPHCYSGTCWTVRWAYDNRVTHHATAWEPRRDRVIGE